MNQPISRMRFSCNFIILATAVSAPFILITLNLGLGEKLAISLLLASVVAAVLAPQPFYASVATDVRLHRVPWSQHLGIAAAAYCAFGLFMAILSIINRHHLPLGSLVGMFMSVWLFYTVVAAVFTGWLLVPLTLWSAARMVKSGNV